jgi:DNA polymerase III epsilon subunit-like protein
MGIPKRISPMDGLLTILDFETTSLENPFAIEIGMIAVDENLQEISRYESVIKPPIDVSKKILGMTRLTSAQLETAPTFEDLWPDIHKFFRNINQFMLQIHPKLINLSEPVPTDR